MPWSVTVNGVDLASLGFYVLEAGELGAADRPVSRVTIPGRAGSVLSFPSSEVAGDLVVRGGVTSSAKTTAAREAAEDAVKDALRAGVIRLTRDNGSTTARQITGTVRQISAQAIGHPLTTSDSRVTFTVACKETYWTAVEWTSRVLGATRATVPLGTAPSSPIIRIMGSATNPVLTYRNAAGTSTKSMTFTVTLNATNDWLDIDMGRGRIQKSVSGTVTNAYSAFTSGDFPWALDPQDGDVSSSAWPTLEVSSGAGLAYWRKMYQ